MILKPMNMFTFQVGSTGKCEYSIEQLKESTEYMFRVIAVNKMGRSAPALTTASITTKKKLRKPQVRKLPIQTTRKLRVHGANFRIEDYI